jgi:hypothetical protein
MAWIFAAFLAASVVHMGEEYFFPGGFMQMMNRLNPRFERLITVPMAVVMNGLQLLLCVIAILVGPRALVFSMSVAGLVFINGLVHLGACFRVRGYAPGAASGALLYIPLALYGYSLFLRARLLTWPQLILTAALGLLYQAIPIAYLFAASALGKGRKAVTS